MVKSTVLCVIGIAISLSGGCATIITGGGHSQTVRFNSDPVGATVFVDGNKIGLTPTVAELTRKDKHSVTMSMEGFDDQTAEIHSGPNGWVFGNLLVGGLVGIFVDIFSGSLEGVLDPHDITCKFKLPMPLPAGATVNAGQ